MKTKTSAKSTKTRQSYKEGDIICIRLDSHQYVYALLIGSFKKLRKKAFWPSEQTGHYFCQLMCVPIILRKFNFVSDKNDLSLEEILKYGLLNPEIIMDDLLLRGDFKIIARKTLAEEDILMPMHYSCYGKHENGGQASAFGMGIFDEENKDNIKAWLKSRMPYYKEINIVFNWGFGAVEMNATSFVDNKASDDSFSDSCSIGETISGLDEDGKLINSGSVFSDDKLQRIFKTMNIDAEVDFDSFNRKYGGLTRKEYLDNIK